MFGKIGLLANGEFQGFAVLTGPPTAGAFLQEGGGDFLGATDILCNEHGCSSSGSCVGKMGSGGLEESHSVEGKMDMS